MSGRRFAALLVLLWANVSLRPSCGETVSIDGRGFSVSVDSDTGKFSVARANPSWQFEGTLDQPLADLQKRTGSDRLGAFVSAGFNISDSQSAEIRAYTDRRVAMFVVTFKSDQRPPEHPFPTIMPPPGLHVASFADKAFAPHKLNGVDGGTPWVWFDDSARAAIFSPGSNFMCASLTGNADDSVSSGWTSDLAQVPAGFSHSTLLVMEDSIAAAWKTWGRAMIDLAGVKRPSNEADVTLKSLGYWTDNGAGYYYNYDAKLGYTATLLAKKDELEKLGIKLGYMQLDSWWYIKTNIGYDGKVGAKTKNPKLPAGSWNCYGGLSEYVAHKDLFPDGLSAFQKKLGLPLVTHNRWVDVNSPYRKDYLISGIAAIDPKWWDHIIGYIASNGVVEYEQDWLSAIYANSPEMASTTTVGAQFTDEMARATAAHGLSMQYCMPTPRYYLQGAKYPNLTNVRTSDDRFDRSRWIDFLFCSQMASSLGEWPFSDVLRSNQTANLLLATLSAGPVGIGDLLGETDAANIAKSVRTDGVIVKPDTAIVPLDSVYLGDAGDKNVPMTAAAFTDHGSHRTAYVFAFPRRSNQGQVRFGLNELGITSGAWVYDWASSTAHEIPAGGKFTADFADPTPQKGWSYFIVAPISPNGIALLGDVGKFVSAGRQRISDISETPEGLAVTVAFASGEKSIELHGFSHHRPTVQAESGRCGPVEYDDRTHEFRVSVSPTGDSASITIR